MNLIAILNVTERSGKQKWKINSTNAMPYVSPASPTISILIMLFRRISDYDETNATKYKLFCFLSYLSD